MIKNYLKTIVLSLSLGVVNLASAQPVDTGDSTALIAILTNNGSVSTTLNWAMPGAATGWDGVTWNGANPQRVTGLQLNTSSCSNNSGAETEFTGAMDFTAFTMLTDLRLGRNTNVTSVDVSGLANLSFLKVVHAGMTALDVSNLGSLDHVKIKNTSISNFNVTNCAALTHISSSGVSSLSSITGLSTTILNHIGTRDCDQNSIIPDLIPLPLNQIRFSNNLLTLTNAVKITHHPSNPNGTVGTQRTYDAAYTTSLIDYSSEAVIDTNGANTATTFELYTSGGALTATNTTGVFSGATYTPGNYYVTMSNAGVSMTTGTITLTAPPPPCVGGPFDSGDSTALKAIANTNFSGSTALNWLIEGCPSNWDGVVWDTTVTPARVSELVLMNDRTSGGNNTNGGSETHSAIVSYTDSTWIWNDNNEAADVVTDLEGDMDFTSLSELKKLHLGRNSVKTIDISGLNKLEDFRGSRMDSIEDVDFSNLSALQTIRMKRTYRLQTVNASNCTNLTRFAASWQTDSLKSVNFDGCTSLEQLNLKDSPNLTSISMSGVTTLIKIHVGDDDAVDNKGIMGAFPSQLYANTNLRVLGYGGQLATGTVDLSAFDSLAHVGLHDNQFTSVTGCDSSLINLNSYLKMDYNRLSLTNAVEIAYNTYAGDVSTRMNPQTNDGATILYTDSLDYSAHDSINVSGTMVASTFTLYSHPSTMVSSNSTGIFNFVLADTINTYYVEMTNSGVTVTTDTIWVLPAAAGIATTISSADFGSVVINDSTSTRVVTIENTGTADLNVTSFTLPTGYSITPTTATIAAGNSSNFTVTFAPTDTIIYAGTLVAVNDAQLSGGTNTVNITGLGIMGDTIPDSTINVFEAISVFEMYPNPTKGLINIKSNSLDYKTLDIYTIQGVLVKEVSIRKNTVDIRDLDNGVYFFRSEDGLLNEKVIKQ